jgi:uncharacterized membrane protein (DUF106 family)
LKTEKTISQLGEEYEQHALLQRFFIDRCKKDIEKAKKSGDHNAVKELEKKLRKFYRIKYEIEQTSLQLKNYYKK